MGEEGFLNGGLYLNLHNGRVFLFFSGWLYRCDQGRAPTGTKPINPGLRKSYEFLGFIQDMVKEALDDPLPTPAGSLSPESIEVLKELSKYTFAGPTASPFTTIKHVTKDAT